MKVFLHSQKENLVGSWKLSLQINLNLQRGIHWFGKLGKYFSYHKWKGKYLSICTWSTVHWSICTWIIYQNGCLSLFEKINENIFLLQKSFYFLLFLGDIESFVKIIVDEFGMQESLETSADLCVTSC